MEETMGVTYDFKCTSCGYLAQVSGGTDFGMMALTETMICTNCIGLVDVIIEARPHSQDLNEYIGLCPNCSTDNVIKWSQDQPCPKCSGIMERGDNVVFWD
jgi:hypothetical protein